MPHKWQQLLADILLTVAGSENGEYCISCFESQQYPTDFLQNLLNADLIEEAEAAKSIICEGCEQFCSMPVEHTPRLTNKPLKYFIFCDKSSSIGHISVEHEELKQWHISRKLITQFLVPHIAPNSLEPEKIWHDGITTIFNHRKGIFKLLLDKTLDLRIGKDDRFPLIELIQRKNNVFSLDTETLNDFANSALSPHASVSTTAAERAAKATMLQIAREAKTKDDFPRRKELWKILKAKHPDLIPAGYDRIRKFLPSHLTGSGRRKKNQSTDL